MEGVSFRELDLNSVCVKDKCDSAIFNSAFSVFVNCIRITKQSEIVTLLNEVFVKKFPTF